MAIRSPHKMSKTFLFRFYEMILRMETFRMKEVKEMSRLTHTSLKFSLPISDVETNRWISWSCLSWCITYFHVTSTSIQGVIHCIFTDFAYQMDHII